MYQDYIEHGKQEGDAQGIWVKGLIEYTLELAERLEKANKTIRSQNNCFKRMDALLKNKGKKKKEFNSDPKQIK